MGKIFFIIAFNIQLYELGLTLHMNAKGVFVVIEGPNGVGKTSIVQSICDLLDQLKIHYYRTKEPTESALGLFIRKNQGILSKEVLACLVAANRYEHLSTVIIPKLETGHLVISDRYFPSSLVYQRMDGLETSFIEDLNQKIIEPDLTVFLIADEKTLSARLEERKTTTRFEGQEKKIDEITFYGDAVEYLISKNWKILTIENNSSEVPQVASKIVKQIQSLLKSP